MIIGAWLPSNCFFDGACRLYARLRWRTVLKLFLLKQKSPFPTVAVCMICVEVHECRKKKLIEITQRLDTWIRAYQK